MLISVQKVHSQDKELVCFSLNAAKELVIQGHRSKIIDSTGFISTVWALVYDTLHQDVIIIGERDHKKPFLHFEDVVVSMQNMKKTNSEDNPGVSIEPVHKKKYRPCQKVVYYGGIENTHAGLVYFQSDYLLKQLSLGFKKTDITGFPSEWDFVVDNQKAGRLTNPWGQDLSLSYFFPAKVRIVNGAHCAALLSLNVKVLTDNEEFARFPKGSLGIEYDNIQKILDRNPDTESTIYARIFTEYLDKIAEQYQVLHELKNYMILSALFSTILKSHNYSALSYWTEEYKGKAYDTPKKIQTLSRSISGVKYSTSLSGGIYTEMEEIYDPWSELVWDKDPKYLYEAAVRSRPDVRTVSWQIPLGFGPPNEWADSLKAYYMKEEAQYLSVKNRNTVIPESFSDNEKLYPRPIATDWKTDHDGKNLFEVNANLLFSYGGFETYSASKKYPIKDTEYSIGRYSVYNSDITVGTLISMEYVYANKLSFGVSVPVTCKLFIEDRPAETYLPGIYDNIMELDGGIENPVFTNRILLYSGVGKGRRKYPSLMLTNSLELPANVTFFEAFLSDEELKNKVHFEYASNDMVTGHSLSSIVPVTNIINIALDGGYLKAWNDSLSRNTLYMNSSLRFLLDRSFGIFFSLNYGTYYKQDVQPDHLKGAWINQGHKLYCSLAFPKKSDYNVISFGYYFPENKKTGGTFLVNFDLSGSRLFNVRKWF